MKKLDLPPFWLALSLVLTWGLAKVFPQLTMTFPGQGWVALVLLVVGILLMVAAVLQMQRARTTFIPRQDPSAMVTGGVFRLSRNPIYLGDALVLAAMIVWTGSLPALVLLYAFPRFITEHFIKGEEERLRRIFGDEFEAWARRTRRWI